MQFSFLPTTAIITECSNFLAGAETLVKNFTPTGHSQEARGCRVTVVESASSGVDPV